MVPWHSPTYIPLVIAQNVNLRYEWDESKLDDLLSRVDDRLLSFVDRLSCRAGLAVTIGFAEWIAARFSAVSIDPRPYQYIEAAWSAVIDDRYLAPWEPT